MKIYLQKIPYLVKYETRDGEHEYQNNVVVKALDMDEAEEMADQWLKKLPYPNDYRLYQITGIQELTQQQIVALQSLNLYYELDKYDLMSDEELKTATQKILKAA